MDEMIWLARNKNGAIWGYYNKPIKKDVSWDGDLCGFSLDKSDFPSIKWEDKEPVQINKKVIDNLYFNNLM